MKLENLVLSMNQIENLRKLGLDIKDTATCWIKSSEGGYIVVPRDLVTKSEYIPTLTFQEILDILPDSIVAYSDIYEREVDYNLGLTYTDSLEYKYSDTYLDYPNSEVLKISDSSNSILRNAYEMLCWILDYKK